MSDFDDAPQWYWAAGDGRADNDLEPAPAGDRFVIASGQRELWSRVRREVNPQERCAWHGFGSKDGKVTLAECMRIFIHGREMYGANYNRVTLELAQIPVWAKFIKDAPSDLCNWVSNPVTTTPLPRAAYDRDVEAALGRQIAATLGIDDQWWL